MSAAAVVRSAITDARRLAGRAALAVACAAGLSCSGAEQQVWFAPLDPTHRPWKPGHGSLDYFELFERDAEWEVVASKLGVFKLYHSFVLEAPENELRSLIAFLERHDIALAVELGALALEGGEGCGASVEGFGDREYQLRVMRRIRDLGGVLAFVAFDEPLFYGSLYEGPQSCRWSTARVAREAGESVRAMRAVFPKLRAGDIEVVVAHPSETNHEVEGHVERYVEWLDVYRTVNGEPLAFLHVDVNWGRADWRSEVKKLRAEVERRGIPFGIIYNGSSSDTSDRDWLARAEERMLGYEADTCGRPPDHAVFQSWDVHPRHVLPESADDTFTGLVRKYFRARTFASVLTEGDELTGSLVDEDGEPVAGVSLAIRLRPSSGPGLAVPIGSTTTGSDGGFRFTPDRPVEPGVVTEVSYAGDDRRWPSCKPIGV